MYNLSIPFTRGWWKVLCAVALSTLLLAVLSMSLGATPAHAASKGQTASLTARATTSQCRSAGNQLLYPTFAIKDSNGNKIGELDIYYNSSNGYNCAYTRWTAGMTGQKISMQVSIVSCQETSSGGGCIATSQDVTDSGMYSDYAGPVGVYAKGHCIAATGSIDGGKPVSTNPYADFCQ
jgi:hypothetical protein